MSKKMRGNLLLLLAAMIWGTSFVAQITGMDYLGPLSFSGIRMLLGGTALLPVIYFFSKSRKKEVFDSGNGTIPGDGTGQKEDKKTLILGGIICGVVLFIASNFQQFGLQYTTAGKGAFITTMYVVFVPIFGFIFMRKRVSLLVWISVAISAVGLYLLSIKGWGFTIEKGDFLVLLCAFAYTLHILVISYFSPKVDGVKMSSIQFYVAGILSLLIALFTETITFEAIFKSAVPILYSGVISAGVGYTLQIVAQKDTDPTIASLLLSLESVFAVIAGALLLGEQMSSRELWGCVIMFVAIVLSQIGDMKSSRAGESQ